MKQNNPLFKVAKLFLPNPQHIVQKHSHFQHKHKHLSTSKQLYITDPQTYKRHFCQHEQHSQLHIYIYNCGISSFSTLNTYFKNLRTLSLDNNNLESIENLTNIYMPSIKKILLFNNNLTSVRALAKMIFTEELVEISLSMNPLIDPYKELSLCDLSSVHELRLYQIGKNYEKQGKNWKSGCSINFCAKFNCFFVQQLGVEEIFDNLKVREKLIQGIFTRSK